MFGQMTAILRLLALALMLAITPSASSAAEITCVQQYGSPPISEDVAGKIWPSGFRPSASTCMVALLQGTIEKGDYERYRVFYRQQHRGLQSLYLASPGGDAEEAMKIGRLVRKYLLTTWAPSRYADDLPFHLTNPSWTVGRPVEYLCQGPTCICASACGLIWFGGVDRTGQVGLHRPKITDPQFKALQPANASTVYRRVVQEISRYLEEMEAPRPLIDGMVATSSAEIRWVDASSDNDQLEHPPSFVEWVDASCGSLTSQERKIESELSARKGFAKFRPGATAPLTEREEILLKMLFEKSSNRSKCRTLLVAARRDALPEP